MNIRQILKYDSTIGYRFIPNLKVRVPHESGGYLLQSNNTGFRSSYNFIDVKTPNYKRILLFGDSFTAGDGVSNKNRYSEFIENDLNLVQVYNYGLPGTGTDQQYLAYQKFTKNVDHDILIIAVLVENIRRVSARYRLYLDESGKEVAYEKPYYKLHNGELFLNQEPLNKKPINVKNLSINNKKHIDQGGRFLNIRKILSEIGLKDLAQRVFRYQPLPEYKNSRSASWLIMSAILKKWISNHDKPIILMPIPLYQYVEGHSDPSFYQDRFQELAESTGCILHDPLPDLVKYTKLERRSFRHEKDVHLTVKGHKAIAKSLIPIIKRTLKYD
jgi:hypothetical protein